MVLMTADYSDEEIDYSELPASQRRHMLQGVAHVHERKGSEGVPQHGDVDDDNDGLDDDGEFEDDFTLMDLFIPMGKALGKNIILVHSSRSRTLYIIGDGLIDCNM